MTQEEMNVLVPARLREIETSRRVKVLYAAESGSRAWGFASPDSDFDVRFIYVRPREDYLRLNPPLDVIEQPVDDTWDVAGWDLDKTLRLLYKSNPTLYEWFSSPIRYLSTPFAERFRPVLQEYFSERTAMHHYLSTARHKIQDILRRQTVRPKQYFYALRPILACEWIRQRHTPPPVPFSELAETMLPDALRAVLGELLELKRNSREKAEIRHFAALDAYLNAEMEELAGLLKQMPVSAPKSWDALNAFFLNELEA